MTTHSDADIAAARAAAKFALGWSYCYHHTVQNRRGEVCDCLVRKQLAKIDKRRAWQIGDPY